jgi:hypothetical protein
VRVLVLCVALISLAIPAAPRVDVRVPARSEPFRSHRGQMVWFDDLSSGAPGWTHGEFAVAPPAFHIDTYHALHDSAHQEDYSWWCGRLDPSYAGRDGYGNDWSEILELPPVDLGTTSVERTSWSAIKAAYRDDASAPPRVRAAAPCLTFAYRHDSEPDHDFTFVEVESLGEWVRLAPPMSGPSAGWRTVPDPGIPLMGYGNPVRIRFRFRSDGAFSDADGLYDSDGGAFQVDDIGIYDALTGELYFLEDLADGTGLSTPVPRPAGGDHWTLGGSACQQTHWNPHAWTVSWPDTTFVPPNLANWLQTPVVEIPDWAYETAMGCTLFYVAQMFMPEDWGGYCAEESTVDGGATWTRVGTWTGDQCGLGYGPCQHFLFDIPIFSDLTGPLSGRFVAARWIVYTDVMGNYASPDCSYQSAGITIGFAWIEITSYVSEAGARGSWESVKSLYR